jgi:hypothetical protein
MAVELVAVRLESTRVALAGRDPGLEAVKPPGSDCLEAQQWRDRNLPFARRRDQRQPLPPRLSEVGADRPDA